MPAFSGRWATCTATCSGGAAADAAQHAFLAGQPAGHLEGVLVLDLDHLIDDVQVEHARNEAGADALDLVPARLQLLRPASVCVMTGLVTGSTAMALKLGLRFLMTSLTPVMVPPVPTPETRISTLPSVSFQISSAVVWRWISRVGRVVELLRHERVGDLAMQFLGLGDGAVHALLAGRQHDLGAEGLEQPAAFEAHGLGHGDDQLVAAGGTGEGQADAGVAAGRLDDRGVLA